MEHGPITTTRRSSWPFRMSWIARRAPYTTVEISGVQGNSRMMCDGEDSSLISRILKSSVLCDTVCSIWLAGETRRIQKKPPGYPLVAFLGICFVSVRTTDPFLHQRLRKSIKVKEEKLEYGTHVNHPITA